MCIVIDSQKRRFCRGLSSGDISSFFRVERSFGACSVGCCAFTLRILVLQKIVFLVDIVLIKIMFVKEYMCCFIRLS